MKKLIKASGIIFYRTLNYFMIWVLQLFSPKSMEEYWELETADYIYNKDERTGEVIEIKTFNGDRSLLETLKRELNEINA